MSEKTYRIGEAAELLNLKTHVLRFWETEFPQLDPLRTDKGQRLYTERIWPCCGAFSSCCTSRA